MSLDLSAKKLAFVGAGSIAESLIRGMTQSGTVFPGNIYVTDHHEHRRRLMRQQYAVHAFDNISDAAAHADVIFFCVKPTDITTALEQTARTVSHDPLYVSVVAGCPLAYLIEHINYQTPLKIEQTRFVRVMPNTSSAVLASATAYAVSHACSQEDAELVRFLLDAVGRSFFVEESMLDAITGLSGSGPAYIYYLVEAMTEAGISAGLSTELSESLTRQTLLGAALMLDQGELSAAQLRQKVTSPGGTTMAGIAALEQDGFRQAVLHAVQAATHRAQEMGSAFAK